MAKPPTSLQAMRDVARLALQDATAAVVQAQQHAQAAFHTLAQIDAACAALTRQLAAVAGPLALAPAWQLAQRDASAQALRGRLVEAEAQRAHLRRTYRTAAEALVRAQAQLASARVSEEATAERLSDQVALEATVSERRDE